MFGPPFSRPKATHCPAKEICDSVEKDGMKKNDDDDEADSVGDGGGGGGGYGGDRSLSPSR